MQEIARRKAIAAGRSCRAGNRIALIQLAEVRLRRLAKSIPTVPWHTRGASAARHLIQVLLVISGDFQP
jgi:hypothetical protein